MSAVSFDAGPAAARRTPQYVSIQVLRGVAALMVVFFHLPGALGLPDLHIPVLSGGVDLFFVISGFVMVVSTRDRPRDPRAFLVQRFRRIVPFYWVMTLVMALALLVFLGRGSSPGQLVSSLMFIPYLDGATGFVQPVLGVGWTLNLEILFYLLFAASMGFGAWRQLAALGAVFAALVVARFVFKPAADTVLFFYTTPMLFEFLAGMALGHLTGRLARLSVPLAGAAIGLAVVSVLVMVLGSELPRTLAQGLPALLLVVGCLGLEGYFRRYAPRFLIHLGDASYSLYLTHTIVLLALTPVVAGAGLSPWIAGAAVVVACVLVSLASYRFIEQQLLALSRRGRAPRRLEA